MHINQNIIKLDISMTSSTPPPQKKKGKKERTKFGAVRQLAQTDTT